MVDNPLRPRTLAARDGPCRLLLYRHAAGVDGEVVEARVRRGWILLHEPADALRAEASLTGLEEKIGFVKKYREIMSADKRIKDIALSVIFDTDDEKINARMREIINIIGSIAVG